jgi:DNA-binding transcriptional MerR regulator
MDDGYLVGEFARRAGVTVRALHHYDRLGLLEPSERTESGYRRYRESDLLRLQQIVTLKALGFDLESIASILNAPDFDFKSALRDQIAMLEARRHIIDSAIQAMRHAQTNADSTHWETLVPIIKATLQMNDMNFEKHYTPEQLEHMRGREFSAADQQRISGLWDALFADIATAADEDPASPAAQALVDRWDALTAEFTQGDPGMQQSLASFYSDKENVEKATAAMPALPAAWAFIQKARAART